MGDCGLKKFPFFSFSPLIIFLFSYIAGLIFGFYFHCCTTLFFVLSGINLIITILYLLKKRVRPSSLAVNIGFFLIGPVAMSFYLNPNLPPDHISRWPKDYPLTIEGFLYRPAEYLPQKIRLYVKTQWVIVNRKKYPTFGNIMLTLEDTEEKFLLFDRIVFFTRLRKPRNFGNPGAFNYVRWLAFRNMYGTGFVSKKMGIVRLGKPYRKSWVRTIDHFRSKAREIINSSASPPANYFLRAVLLGERQALPEEINESFARTGTSHILAISGLHIGIVGVLAYRLFRWLLSRSEYLLLAINVPKLSSFLSLLPMFFYALIAGTGVSVKRAFIMAATYIVALLLNRERNLYQTISLAAFLILAFQPSALFEASFQLSFGAVFGIIFFTPKLLSFFNLSDYFPEKTKARWWENLNRHLIIFIAVTVSAMLATSPLTARYFHLVSPSGLLANLLMVPLAGFLVVTGLVGIFFVFFSSIIAENIFSLVGFLGTLSTKIINIVSNFPGAGFLVPTPSLATIFLFYLALFSLFLRESCRQAKKIFVISLVLLTINSLYSYLHLVPHGLKVTFIDVGQGDSIFVNFPEGKTMLIDGGGFPNQDFDVGKNIVAPFLLHQGVRRIDYLVLTHPHPDHYTGLIYIAKNFSIGEFWSNGDVIDDFAFWNLQKILVQKNIPIRNLHYNF
ncbi:MAG: DNA internalization-related competence protein ComEC/Rec2, partial [Desulfobacterota bacterium]|nr:DNA internalization-related competence protein ComEC/Rec2 [Thermodesulfobacteriota bacterium]